MAQAVDVQPRDARSCASSVEGTAQLLRRERRTIWMRENIQRRGASAFATESSQHGSGQRKLPATGGGFGRPGEFDAIHDHALIADIERASGKVDVGPAKPQQLASAEAAEESEQPDVEQRGEALRLKERVNLRSRPERDRSLLVRRRAHGVDGICGQQPHPDGILQRAAQQDPDELRLPGATGSAEGREHGENMGGRQLAQRHVADQRIDVQP